eukprot:Skav208402  [mRNA]  locus=scaffold1179:182708:183511:- [translate_table: standard]
MFATERTKRRCYDDFGPVPKRRRTAVEELRTWANEWPIQERVEGTTIDYKEEDVVLDSANGYAVVKNPPEIAAAQLRVLEKNFVTDHAELLVGEPWLKELTPQELCESVGVLSDEVGDAVTAIKSVMSGKTPKHFTLPLVEKRSKQLAGYVHATYTPEKGEMAIAHLKVDGKHTGKGLGGILISAAEDYSEHVGWKCRSTYLSVLEANARARQCYLKAGFKFESSATAQWGSHQHAASEWQRWGKVHKHHCCKKRKKFKKRKNSKKQ